MGIFSCQERFSENPYVPTSNNIWVDREAQKPLYQNEQKEKGKTKIKCPYLSWIKLLIITVSLKRTVKTILRDVKRVLSSNTLNVQYFRMVFNIAALVFHIKILLFGKLSFKLRLVSGWLWVCLLSFLISPHSTWTAFCIHISLLWKNIQIQKITKKTHRTVAAYNTFSLSSVLLSLSFNLGLISISFSFCFLSLFPATKKSQDSFKLHMQGSKQYSGLQVTVT